MIFPHVLIGQCIAIAIARAPGDSSLRRNDNNVTFVLHIYIIGAVEDSAIATDSEGSPKIPAHITNDNLNTAGNYFFAHSKRDSSLRHQ